jgi:hypothetical protein
MTLTNGNGDTRRVWAVKILLQHGPGWALAGFLVYQIVMVFLPALISEMKAHTTALVKQTSLLNEHAVAGKIMERHIPLILNMAVQDCANQARANEQSTQSCFAVARGEQPR